MFPRRARHRPACLERANQALRTETAMKKKSLSIKEIFAQTNKLMLILAIQPLLVSILMYSRQIVMYQETIKNVQKANAIASNVDGKVLGKMWDLVFGETAVSKYQENNVIKELRQKISLIQQNTHTAEESSTLDVSLRTLNTLKNYEKKIIKNIRDDRPVEENQELMNQVDSVTQLLSDILHEFVSVEINAASRKNTMMIHSLLVLSLFELIIVICIIAITHKNRRLVNQKIQKPLNDLILMSEELAKGNLFYRSQLPEATELASLTASLNKMADDLTQLLEENALKQYHLAQSEVKVLQAQITPHFVYNSMDAILSLIEQKNYEEAKQTTYALSDFFRISLSKGKDWIDVEKEIRHIQDYLFILKIRYGEMLQYEISIPEGLKHYQILKMILQPLVENAVGHGTKFNRRVGKITILASETPEHLIFEVKDNGIGMTPERLEEIQEELEKGIGTKFNAGYGLLNVNKRLILYYGQDAGIKIESEYRKGTNVTITVAKRKEEDSDV